MKKNQLLEKSLLLTSILLMSFMGLAQVSEAWVARYNGPGNHIDQVLDMAVDASGNVYVTGISDAPGSGTDYATIKYSSTGVLQWLRRYNGPANHDDEALAIALDNYGNVYITGASRGVYSYDYATIKYSSAGVEQWVKRYNGTGYGTDWAKAIVTDKDGNVYITGHSLSAGAPGADYTTIKYSAAGEQIWLKKYDGPANSTDDARSIAIDQYGNVFVTGASVGGVTTDYATLKYNSAGVEQWVKRYNGPANGEDAPSEMILDASGNTYVTGRSGGTASGDDYATIKYNSVGAQLWVSRYNGPGNNFDQAKSLAVDPAGNVYVTGVSYGTTSETDYATVKYNSSGVQQWVVRYNGPANSGDGAYSLALDASANVYVTGWSYGPGTGSDFATLKYNSSGTLKWLIRYNGPAVSEDRGTSIVLDVSGYVYVSGYSTGPGTNTDYTTIKYSQTAARPIVAMPTRMNLPAGFKVSNYPNPVSVTTRIRYEIPFDGQVSVKIYDALGREVATLVNANMKAGYHSTDFNAAPVQNGVYYYKIIVNTEKKVFKESRKILVVK